MKGIPRKQRVRYSTVPGTASAGVCISAASGWTRKVSPAARTILDPRKKVTVFPVIQAVCSRLPPPTAWAMDTVVPMARPTSITVTICIT